MSLNPLTPVTDYQSMLNRIFWFTSAAALVAIWMLRLYIPGLDVLLKKIDFSIAFGSARQAFTDVVNEPFRARRAA
jgi:hypothetical protein